MKELEIIQKYESIINPGQIISLIQKQLKSYGADSNYDRIKNALENALSPGKRTILFLWKNEPHTYNAFAFCNICSGLESGGDYLWINELFVDDNGRRKGTGSRFLSVINNWCKEQKICYIECVTGINNEVARGFYNKNGYKLGEVLWVDKKV